MRGLTEPRSPRAEVRRAEQQDELGAALGRLTEPDVSPRERGVLLLTVARLLGRGGRRVGARAALSTRHLVDLLVDDVAPHVPVRDLLTLREHHGGLSGDELADALVKQASLVTAGIGAAAGALASAEMVAPPALLAAPVQLVAETLATVVVELKLVAELHVVYGRAPLGSRGEVTAAYVASWATRSPVQGLAHTASVTTLLSAATRQQVRGQLARRLRRSLASLAPLLAGAVAGAELNRRETRALGESLQRGLVRRR